MAHTANSVTAYRVVGLAEDSEYVQLVPFELLQTGQSDVNPQTMTEGNDDTKEEMNNQNVLHSSSMNLNENFNNNSIQNGDNNTQSYREMENETLSAESNAYEIGNQESLSYPVDGNSNSTDEQINGEEFNIKKNKRNSKKQKKQKKTKKVNSKALTKLFPSVSETQKEKYNVVLKHLLNNKNSTFKFNKSSGKIKFKNRQISVSKLVNFLFKSKSFIDYLTAWQCIMMSKYTVL